ncbi:hypothetical protein SAMN05421770_101254 [Granulicella rosea]|uniref:Uncharacterized protein n=1 Tax=Granulicella rosea TaxID=474952 RepID=A0A239D2A1_9BACT|nr:hypothetical protein SAMN05421770_101254 [Granulicella rosea]
MQTGNSYALPFSRLLAAAAFASAFFSPAVWVFFGLQLPLVPGSLPGTGSNPGQQWLALFFAAFFADFFAVVIPL